MTAGNGDFRNRPGGTVVSQDERIPETIRNINLGPMVWKLTDPESESSHEVDWTVAQTVRVCEEYRKFLTLSLLGDGRITAPSRNIDIIWHQHILDTEKYHADMQTVFGHMLHHFPYLGVRGSDDRQVLLDAYEDTKKRYEERFGPVPEDVWGMAAHCGVSSCSTPTNCSDNRPLSD
ncbi:MAG: hypothetical protein RIE31_09610 [Alphaproteobacteria bacterium]